MKVLLKLDALKIKLFMNKVRTNKHTWFHIFCSFRRVCLFIVIKPICRPMGATWPIHWSWTVLMFLCLPGIKLEKGKNFPILSWIRILMMVLGNGKVSFKSQMGNSKHIECPRVEWEIIFVNTEEPFGNGSYRSLRIKLEGDTHLLFEHIWLQ